MRFETDLHPTPPYDFDRSLGFLGPKCPDPIATWDGRLFRRNWPLEDNRSALVSLRSLGQLNQPMLRLEAEGDELQESDLKSLIESVSESFSLGIDLEVFYRSLQGDPILYNHCRINIGLKPVRKPTLFEVVTWAIIGQQINLRFACQMKRGMLETYAKRVEHDGQIYFKYPTAAELAALNPSDWKKFKCSERKAQYIIGLAQEIQSGFNLEALKDRNDNEIVQQLTSLRGLGKWTAEYTLIMGFGRWDAFPITDAGLINGIKRVYRLGGKLISDEIVTMAEKWKPYRGLATYYLWWGQNQNKERS